MRNKGSLTIEAIISFTIFISFMFMLLTMVKFALTDITLACATSETAKQLATAAYPVQMINDIENEMDDDAAKYVGPNSGPVTLAQGLTQTISSTFINMMFAGSSQDIGKAASGGLDGLLSLFLSEAKADVWNFFRDNIAQIKSDAKNAVAANIFNTFVQNSYVNIDKSKLTIEVVELPQSNYEYNHHKIGMAYTDMGLVPGTNFRQDDVVIGIKYQYQLLLPFLPAINVNMREVAVEHAWIHGADGTITSKTEGIDLDSIVNFLLGTGKVYVGSGGHSKCYHLEKCFTIEGHSQEISRKDAYLKGLRPCKHCQPNKKS